eukprot:TRINITY_DN10407_c0_g1_i2.p2 TRINITY_DN10407_c0_g1~~TRINITY_DN10407_c0_g1_i2.p2  ORF type:complete len:124 (-),score=2.49 TRINITY_DN10407_c0_g1_i2:760-1131(-)
MQRPKKPTNGSLGNKKLKKQQKETLNETYRARRINEGVSIDIVFVVVGCQCLLSILYYFYFEMYIRLKSFGIRALFGNVIFIFPFSTFSCCFFLDICNCNYWTSSKVEYMFHFLNEILFFENW